MKRYSLVAIVLIIGYSHDCFAGTFKFRCDSPDQKTCYFSIALGSGVTNFTSEPADGVIEHGDSLNLGDQYFVAGELSDADSAKCADIKKRGGWCRGPISIVNGINR